MRCVDVFIDRRTPDFATLVEQKVVKPEVFFVPK
jgi:hypothetical protein